VDTFQFANGVVRELSINFLPIDAKCYLSSQLEVSVSLVYVMI